MRSRRGSARSGCAPVWIEMPDLCDQVLRLVCYDMLAGQVVVLGPQLRN